MKKIFLLLFLLPVILTAKIITLDEAIEIALNHSYSLEVELQNYKNSEMAGRTEIYSWLPTSSVSMGKSFSDGEWNDVSKNFSFGWDIASNDERYFSMKKQIIDMKNAELSLENIRKIIAFQVLKYYLEVLKTEENILVDKELLEMNKKKFEKNTLKFELGEIDQIKLDESELPYIRAELTLNSNLAALDNNRSNFFNYINLKDEGQEFSSIKLELDSEEKPFRANLDYLIDLNDFDKLEIDREKAFMDMMPVLTMGYRYTNQFENDNNQMGFDSESYSISLNLSYSIFNFFNTYENYKFRKRSIALEKLDLENTEKENNNVFRKLNNDFKMLKKNYELSSRESELALRALERAQLKFDQGAVSILELNEQQETYYTARKNEINYYYDALSTQENINLQISDKILGKW